MKQTFRSAILVVISAFGFASAASAVTPEAAPVNALDAGLLATMKAAAAGKSFQERYNTLDPVVQKAFNLPELSKNSVGFLWATLPAVQQQQLTELFEQFTVVSYVSQFNSYSGESFNLQPTEKPLGVKKIIETQLVPTSGDPIELDYVVQSDPQGWKITDVLLNGTISQVAVHASDFASLVSSGDASPLISALKNKIAVLSNGTVGR
jgi:phospholipid transport system substrate-binding protein